MSLRVSNLNGKVTLTLPKGIGEATARAFLDDKRDWLTNAVAKVPAAKTVRAGGEIDFQGQRIAIRRDHVRSAGLSADGRVLLLPQGATQPGQLAKYWVRQQARRNLVAQCDAFCEQLRCSYSKLTLRDTRSRWGSCSAAGGLMFSWRLVMAPPDVLNYVAAHEVAHLVEMNHAPAFWQVVEQLMPAYQEPRKWLKDNGADLHRWKFDD